MSSPDDDVRQHPLTTILEAESGDRGSGRFQQQQGNCCGEIGDPEQLRRVAMSALTDDQLMDLHERQQAAVAENRPEELGRAAIALPLANDPEPTQCC
mgnify:CR=1 FL=1